jgi:6,7-dimethyl-8-ribityllumazine synthase
LSELETVRRIAHGALAALEASRRRIDDLNVYPVPDGDTGTNLTLTARALVEELDRSKAEDRAQLAREATRAALMGARGNSGVIFSQIVRGAADVLGEPGAVDVPRALRSASDAAYRAVRRPVEGTPHGGRRGVAIVAARFNGDVVSRLIESALEELERTGVQREAITVMPVPGAFELPLAAMALAKTRRFACIVALGCVIRGETPHFEYVAGEAASGLQLAALETGVPVAFGVLTVENVEQAEARIGKGAEAVRSALEMADVFAQLRASAHAAR